MSSLSAPSPPPHDPGCFSLPPASSSPPSGFFNEMLGVSEPGVLNCYTLFCLIPLNLIVSRNLTSSHLPLSESRDSLLCDLMAPTSGPVFFLLMSHTLGAASLFLSGRGYPSLNFLSLSLNDPYSKYVGVNISLSDSSSLSFLNVYAPPIRSSPQDSRTNFFSLHSSLHKCLFSGRLQLPSPPLGLKRYFQPLWGKCIRLGHLL